MEQFAREDVREVLSRYGVASAGRAVPADPTEEVIILDASDYERVPVDELTQALMVVLPHMKVWVAPAGDIWESEPL